MAKLSAGILLFRHRGGRLQVLLVHPGGPFWEMKDQGSWSIPKGEYGPEEDPLTAARREFLEETGMSVPDGETIPLSPLKQPSGKVVSAWAIEGDLDVSRIRSNTFSLEWPPRSGRRQDFPEVDRGEWLDLDAARGRIQQGQAPFLEELSGKLGPGESGPERLPGGCTETLKS